MSMLPHTSSNLIRAGLAVLIVAIALMLAVYFTENKKETKKKTEKAPESTLVQTQSFTPGDHIIQITAMGQVAPSLSTDLKPRVSGEILRVASEFVPGGYFEKGETILEIDPADYKLEIEKKKAALQQAQADFDLEMGRQEIAKDELAVLQKSTGQKIGKTDLALRRPQLEQARANVEQAKADLALAELDLARTRLTSPFNALVSARNVNLGDVVSAQETLATLVSTDEYWIELSVPVHDMIHLTLPDAEGRGGSRATVMLDGNRGQRGGKLVRMTGTLDPQSRLVSMLVSVPDPLLLDYARSAYMLLLKNRQGADIFTQKTEKPPMVLGDYVQVALEGKTLHNAVRLPVPDLRDGNTIWIAHAGTLDIRKVSIAYRDRDYAYITAGITPGDVVITSDIPAPIAGMPIRIENAP